MANSGDFVGMKEIYGHEVDLNLPLELVARELAKDESGQVSEQGNAGSREWAGRYAAWLQKCPYSSFISFVDITFAPIGAARATREVTTLIVGPSAIQREQYRLRLADYLKTPASISAHPVFGNGLPLFENRSANSDLVAPETETPDTEARLRQLREEKNWAIRDDGFLLWTSEDMDVLPSSEIKVVPGKSEFSAEFIATFRETAHNLSRIPASITSNWELYVSAMKDMDNLRVLAAAPIGVRSGSNGEFVSVADVFFGLNRSADRPVAGQFLKFIALHLLRTNAGFNAQILASKRLQGVIGHEVKKVAVALTEDWAPRAERLFEITVSESTNIPDQQLRNFSKSEQAPPETVGHIVLKPRYSFLKSNLGILPFRTQVQVAGKSLRFWSYANKITDQPFPDGLRSPQTWDALIQACWETAREQIILFALTGRGAGTPHDVESLARDICDLKKVFEAQKPQVYQWNPENLQHVSCNWFSSDPKEWSRLFALSRVLIALFGNCLQHGNLFFPVGVGVERTKSIHGNEYHMRIVNELRSSPPEDMSGDRLSNARFRELFGLLNSANGISSAMSRLQEGSTPDVIKASLADLNGELITMGADPENPRCYIVLFSFRWSD